MKKIERISIEQSAEDVDRASVQTQIELDLICGAVGFDDEPIDDEEWVKKAIKRHKKTVKKQKGEADE